MQVMVVDQYWAAFIGVATAMLNEAGVHVVPHAGLAGYDGAWLFSRGRATIVSVPPALLDYTRRAIAGDAFPRPRAPSEWLSAFGRPVANVVGPAYHGFAETLVRPSGAHAVQRLGPDHRPLLDRLAASCVGDEWAHASIDPQSREPVFGCFAEGVLAGVAQNEPRSAGAVSPGVVTAPQWRRQGIGAAVLAAAMGDALGGGRVVLYQTLVANHASVRLGESLGVVPYAEHVAYRFADGGERWPAAGVDPGGGMAFTGPRGNQGPPDAGAGAGWSTP